MGNPNHANDHGLKGSNSHDRITVHNAHPHQAHTHSEDVSHYHSHGLMAMDITHDRRQKGEEHHPPLGLDAAIQHSDTMQNCL
jgi:hypothetical protein